MDHRGAGGASNGGIASVAAGTNAQSKKRSRPGNESFLRTSSSVRQAKIPAVSAVPTLHAAASSRTPVAGPKAKALKRSVQPLTALATLNTPEESTPRHEQMLPSAEARIVSSASATFDITNPLHIEQVWQARRMQFLDRCLRYIQKLAAANDSILHYGEQLAICLRVVMEGACGDLRQRALTSLEPLMNAWHEIAVRQLHNTCLVHNPSPESILAVIQSVYSIERCRRPFVAKDGLLRMLDWTRFSATEYLTWDPRVGPSRLEEDAAALRKYTNALVYVYHAEYIGVDIGCRFIDVFRWLPIFRPYKSALEVPMDQYADQLRLIFHVVMTNSGWGQVRLLREWFVHEWGFLKAQLPLLVQMRETSLAAQCLRSLRVFGATDDEAIMQQGMRLLMGYPLPDETVKRNQSHEADVSEAILSVQAMVDCNDSGIGPIFLDVLPMLFEWMQTDHSQMGRYLQTTAESHRLYEQLQRYQYTHLYGDEKMDTPIGSDISSEDLKKLMAGFRARMSHDFVELGSYLRQSSTPGHIKSILQELAKHEVTLDLLRSTRVAKQVNKLSSHADPAVAALAQRITAKWRGVVKQAGVSSSS